MFEPFFGLTHAPFELSPDPSFFYMSKGHSRALAYLKFGLYQKEGFIVITGEIGAGKTTLLRTLVEDLDPKKVVAAQILNTQLDEDELLESICAGFGVPIRSRSKASMLHALEGFFIGLAMQGRRALLIVDEAQNLGVRQIEELRMLSNFQLGNGGALLQSFLVGQPELRKMISSPSMEQLRQRVIASYHLGPLDKEETASYIEHRLQNAGWEGAPIFDSAALDKIFAFTGGIPRRINLLSSRLLLGAFLNSVRSVDRNAVIETATDLQAETDADQWASTV